MSSTNGQPPLTRRQVRDLERAREAGEAITGSISVVSGSPVPSNMPVTTPSPATPPSRGTEPVTSRPGSHVAAPASAGAPGSAPLVDGHTPTRRELRAQREASAPAVPTPVPLKAPQPASDRNLSDALSHVADIGAEAPASRKPVAPEQSSQPTSQRGAAEQRAAAQPAAAPRDASPASPSSPPQAGTPEPRAFRRSDETPSFIAPASTTSQDATGGDAESAPVRRRSTGSEPVVSGLASSTPPPTSTPTVFPFALSGGSAPTPSGSVPTSGSAPTSVAAAASASDSPAGSAPVAPAERPQPVTPAASATPSASATPEASAPSASSTAPAPLHPAAPTAPASRAAAPAAQPRQVPSIPASVPEAQPFVPPTGHWSTQADLDDDTVETVGSHFGTMTGQQNALIVNDDSLPDVTGALNATGEVIITGSIDLPRSLATTGSHNVQRIDGADIDRMLEEGDRETASNEATPVRASRAVSANTSTRAVVLAGGKPKTHRLPIILTCCGIALGLVIVGLVVWGLTSGVLSH